MIEAIILGAIGSLIATIVWVLMKQWWDAKSESQLPSFTVLSLSDDQGPTAKERAETVLLNEAIQIFNGRVEILTAGMLSHPASPRRIQQFYAGAKLDWDVIAAQGDIPRDQHEEFLKHATEPSEGTRLVCIIAEAGAGKSTSAWRIAAELHQRHKRLVLHIKGGDSATVWYSMAGFYARVGRPFYVLIDDIFHDPSATLAFHQLNPWLPITVLATSRANEYHPRQLKCEAISFDLKPPSPDEKERIVIKLGKRRSELTNEQRARLDRANQFLVLMMELTGGKELSEIVRDTLGRLHEIDEPAYRAYEYICFAYKYSVAIPTLLLERLDEHGRFYNLPDRPTTEGLIFWDSGLARIRAGHSVIAETAAGFYAQSHAPQIVIEEIGRALDVTCFEERQFFAFVLRMLAKKQSPILKPMPEQLENAIVRCVGRANSAIELTLWRAFYRDQGQLEQAKRAVESALKLEPVSPADCNTLWYLFRERGREQDALPVVASWVKRNPDWGSAGVIYLGLIERHGTAEQVAHVVQETSAWLSVHADDNYVRTAYLGLVERKGTAEQVAQVVQETGAWLASHSEDRNVRTAYLGLVERKGTPDQIAQTVHETSAWLSKHPDSSHLRTAYLGLVGRKGTTDQVAQVVQETSAWLASQADDHRARTAYLGLVERKGTAEQIAQTVQETSAWLASHSEDNHLRTSYLGLVERKGTAEQVAQTVHETSAWLASRSEDRNVRTAYLGLVERKGTADQIAQTVDETSAWLSGHADDNSVRTAYLGLVERKGTAEQVAQAVQETSAWLSTHPDDHYVRTAYLGLVERKGTTDQVTQVVQETSAWLLGHLTDITVRERYVGLIERKGSTEQIAEVIKETNAWLSTHPKDENVRVAWLGLVEARSSDEVKKAAIIDTKVWLIGNDWAREVWRALLAWMLRSKQSDEAVELAVAAVSRHPNDKHLLEHSLHVIQETADDKTVRKLYEQLLNKWGNDLVIQLFYANWLGYRDYYDEAECRYQHIIEKEQNSIQAHYGYGKLLLKLERFGEAAAEFRAVLKIRWGHQMAHDGLGLALWKLGDYRQAEREFRSALHCGKRHERSTAKVYADLGWFYADRTRFPDALNAFESARDEDAEYFGNYWGIGLVLYELGDYEGAESSLRTALAKKPDLEPPASDEIADLLDQCRRRVKDASLNPISF
jgi:tetratricopeptide (TPR) repeat protein